MRLAADNFCVELCFLLILSSRYYEEENNGFCQKPFTALRHVHLSLDTSQNYCEKHSEIIRTWKDCACAWTSTLLEKQSHKRSYCNTLKPLHIARQPLNWPPFMQRNATPTSAQKNHVFLGMSCLRPARARETKGDPGNEIRKKEKLTACARICAF